MIPVEKIASGTLNNLVLYVGIVGLLLVIAALIRLKVPILRKAFIPASPPGRTDRPGPWTLRTEDHPQRYDELNRSSAYSDDHGGICLYAFGRSKAGVRQNHVP